MWDYGKVKMTAEIPDFIFRRAKSVAAERAIPLRQFVGEALQEKLSVVHVVTGRPWMKHMGKLRHLCAETKRIEKLIEEAFE